MAVIARLNLTPPAEPEKPAPPQAKLPPPRAPTPGGFGVARPGCPPPDLARPRRAPERHDMVPSVAATPDPSGDLDLPVAYAAGDGVRATARAARCSTYLVRCPPGGEDFRGSRGAGRARCATGDGDRLSRQPRTRRGRWPSRCPRPAPRAGQRRRHPPPP